MSVWKTYTSLRTQSADPKLHGTVTHIPPERLEDYAVRLHETADVYGFGILVWEILTEKQPYEGLHAINFTAYSFIATQFIDTELRRQILIIRLDVRITGKNCTMLDNGFRFTFTSLYFLTTFLCQCFKYVTFSDVHMTHLKWSVFTARCT